VQKDSEHSSLIVEAWRGEVLEGVSGTHDHDFPLHDVVVFETSRETLHRVLLELCDGRSLLESRIYTEIAPA
jgi:hypothetical protein